jgi:cellulose synthase/poly-beta-1,6-N-acetylglucosamine synthase-like glycosyltransferase
MNALFWISLLTLAYAFAGYPLLVAILGHRRRFVPSGGELPRISVLLSVYNEERVITAKIRNFLELDYPQDRIELLVVSDGSDDATEALVAQYASPQVRLLRQPARGGKTRAINSAAREAAGDILVFTDANAMFRPGSMRNLVAPFASEDVGLVGGRSVYADKDGRETPGGLYRRYEEWIKNGESGLFSIVGADGAIYALRKELFEPLRPEYINDFLHPIQVVLRGKRAISEPSAVVVEAGEENGAAELRRQTRIMAQSWLLCLRFSGDLVQAGRLGFLWQLVSHKMLRWLTLPLLAVLGASAIAGAGSGVLQALVLFGLAALAVSAWAGFRGRGGIAHAAWMFLILHWAALLGLFRLVQGERFVTWNPRGN